WSGNNGGATWRGVTPTEVRVAVVGSGQNSTDPQGPLATQPAANESTKIKTLRLLQAFFNQRFQLYGRQLRLVNLNAGLGVDAQDTAAAQAQQYGVFAGVTIPPWGLDSLAK